MGRSQNTLWLLDEVAEGVITCASDQNRGAWDRLPLGPILQQHTINRRPAATLDGNISIDARGLSSNLRHRDAVIEGEIARALL